MSDSADFAALMGPVSELVLPRSHGEPNKKLSTKTQIRYGNNGSLCVDLVKGVYSDHEDGSGGGVIDLLKAYMGFDKAAAVAWLRDQGFLEKQSASYAARELPKFEGIPSFFDPKPIAVFDYRDDKGNLAIQVVKFPKEAPRRYMQRRPGPNGTWIWALEEGKYGKNNEGAWFRWKEDGKYVETKEFPKATRWLYRLDEIVKAKVSGAPVLVVEGEKDVETLRSWGITATTNIGGAKFWEDKYDDDLSGVDVILCGDNDDTGRLRMMTLGARLKKKAKSVRIIDLALHWPDMPAKADVSDWKASAGGTAEKFSKLVETAPHWQITPPKSLYSAISWRDLEKSGDEPEYLIDGWLTEGDRSVVGGPSGSGKSFLSIHLAMCVARGVDFFQYPAKKGGVIYQAGEGGRGLKKRLKAYRKQFGVSVDDDIPFVLLPHKVDLFSKEGDTEKLIQEINAWALTMSDPLRLVVIDTLATATAGADENSGKDMGMVLQNIATISERTGAHVQLVHHMNAEGKKLRGHTSVYANVDQVIQVVSDPDTKVKTATLVKQKDDEDGVKLHFSLGSVVVGYDEKASRDITSCVVLSVEEKERLKREQEKYGFSPKPTERKILMNFFKAASDHGVFVASEEDGPAEAIGRVVVDYKIYSKVCIDAMVEVEDQKRAYDQVKKEWARNSTWLIKSGVLGLSRPYMWWTGKPIRGFQHTFTKGNEPWTDAGQNSDKSTTISNPVDDDAYINNAYAEGKALW
ncbi:MAG: AAA family ATPase [Ahrensia sp.]|nr:AAA family ATPase [Ahrensia sp.]